MPVGAGNPYVAPEQPFHQGEAEAHPVVMTTHGAFHLTELVEDERLLVRRVPYRLQGGTAR